MFFLISTAFWLVIGVVAIAVYGLCCLFGKSGADETTQQLGLISDADLSRDNIEQAMWEAGKHDITKQVDIPIVPKQKVHDVRTAEQIQAEDHVDAGTALAMSDEELVISDHSHLFDDSMEINPATGLPMMGGIGGIDVAGNPYGFDNDDMYHDDDWHRSSLDD